MNSVAIVTGALGKILSAAISVCATSKKEIIAIVR